ncbi:MAG: dTMP kinase [Bacillota bacterium]
MSYFITLEGGEGSGKTTALAKLAERLTADGFEVVTTREPGGIAIAEKIREVILDRTHTAMDARTEALLYAAARRQHLVERVLPALQAGKIILCDRFVDSSLAYQGHARGLGLDDVLAINEFAIEGHMPNLTLYFDVNPKTGLARIDLDKGREFNRLDEESLAFHYKVREGYLLLLGRYPERMQLINAENDLDEVVADAYEVLQRFLVEKE